MTTKVTVDAHAGWDVQVGFKELDQNSNVTHTYILTVKANTTQDFYIYSSKEIDFVREVKT